MSAAVRHLYLIDNSVTQRVHREPAVTHAVVELLSTGDFATCLPLMLEEGYSARTPSDHDAISTLTRESKVILSPNHDVLQIATDLQARLFRAGIGRSVGVSNLQITATALAHSSSEQLVTVIHYDAVFESVAAVSSEFRHRWIVPRGSVS